MMLAGRDRIPGRSPLLEELGWVGFPSFGLDLGLFFDGLNLYFESMRARKSWCYSEMLQYHSNIYIDS